MAYSAEAEYTVREAPGRYSYKKARVYAVHTHCFLLGTEYFTHGSTVGGAQNNGEVTSEVEVLFRRDAGAVDRGGLENRCAGNRTEGSNPSLSAFYFIACNHERPATRQVRALQRKIV